MKKAEASSIPIIEAPKPFRLELRSLALTALLSLNAVDQSIAKLSAPSSIRPSPARSLGSIANSLPTNLIPPAAKISALKSIPTSSTPRDAVYCGRP